MATTKSSPLANLPALSDSSLLRYIAFTALYMAQGLPAGLMNVAIPAWLAKHSMGTGDIGIYLGIIGLPWSLKLIGGPIMDRFAFLPMGRRRPWVLSAQLGIIIGFWTMATLTDPVNNLYWLAGIGFIINFCTAFQDVAVDGLAIEVLPSEQQARANGLMWGGKIVGFSISSATGSYFLNQYGFGNAFLLLSSGIILIFILPLLLRERPGERLLPWTSGSPSAHALKSQITNSLEIMRSLFKSVWLPMSRLTVVGFFFYAMGEGILGAVAPVLFIQELGWQDTEYSQIMATSGLISGLAGMLLGALVVGRLGRVRTILIAGTLLALSYLVMGFLDHLWTSRTILIVFIFTKGILGVTITVAYLAACMDLCWQRVAASQFSLFMALANLGNSTGEALTGPIDAVLDYAEIFIAIAFIKLIAMTCFYFVNLNTHKKHLNQLENQAA